MTRTCFLVLCLVLLSLSPFSIMAQQIRYSLSSDTSLLGEPVFLDVSLNAAVPKGEVWVTCEGFLQILVEGPKGPCKRVLNPSASLAQPYSPWERATIRLDANHPAWTKRFVVNEEYDIAVPGRYSVQITWRTPSLDALGLERATKVLRRECPGLKPRFLESFNVAEEATIQFHCPSGLDAQAYKLIVGGPCPTVPYTSVTLIRYAPETMIKLLRTYPTSTYTAYVIYGRMSALIQSDFAAPSFVGAVQTGRLLSNDYPDPRPENKTGWQWLSGQAAADWWAKWYEIILKAHPDIWFADELRLKRAVDQMCLKNYQTAQADLETLLKDPSFKQKAKAQLCLDLMKEKGWIKP